MRSDLQILTLMTATKMPLAKAQKRKDFLVFCDRKPGSKLLSLVGKSSLGSLFVCSAYVLVACLTLFGGGRTAHALQREATGITEKTIPILDATGRSVDVRLPVKRIVVLTSDALEVIHAIKAEGLVTGVNSGIAKDPLFWPGLKDLPSVGSWRNPNYELIAQLNPDMVIGYAHRPGPAMERKLRSLGIQVVRLDFYKMNTLEQEVRTLGRILDREKEAAELIKWYGTHQDLIGNRLKQITSRPRVYVESYSKYHTTGPGSGGNEMCLMAGGANVAKNFSIPYPEVTPEWVVAKDPQYIIKAAALSNAYGKNNPARLKAIKKEIMIRPAWNIIRAVRQEKIHVIESSIWTGPRAIIGILYMAKWFHPPIFEDMDPEAIHRYYLQRFQGIPYRGSFVE